MRVAQIERRVDFVQNVDRGRLALEQRERKRQREQRFLAAREPGQRRVRLPQLNLELDALAQLLSDPHQLRVRVRQQNVENDAHVRVHAVEQLLQRDLLLLVDSVDQVLDFRFVLDQFLLHQHQLTRVLLELFQIRRRRGHLLVLLLEHVQSVI